MKKLTLILVTSLILTACGDELEPETTPVETEAPKPVEVIEPPPEEIDHGYELDEFSFHGKTNLTEDLRISAKDVFFRFNSEVKINAHTLTIDADTVIFEEDSRLVAYYYKEYNACKKPGKHAGEVQINSSKIEGAPFIDLAGQNSGQIGIYSAEQAKTPIHPSHEKLDWQSRSWFRGCGTYIKDKGPIHVPHLLVSKPGGNHGNLYLKVDNYENFKPDISNRFSHGSYDAIVEGITKGRTSWWRTVIRGPNGTPGKVCFDVDGDFLCK